MLRISLIGAMLLVLASAAAPAQVAVRPAQAAVAPVSSADSAYAAYSTRRAVAGYAGPAVTVRREGDDATQAIGFDGDGNLDTSALLSFVNAPISDPTPAARPLDALGATEAAFSLRKLRTGYAGSALRVSRIGDGAQTDIGFTGGGDLDTTALTDFAAADTKENMLVRSEDLSNAAWVKSASSVTAAGTHNGSAAWQVTETATTAAHYLQSGNFTRPAGTAFVVRVRVQDAGRRYVQIATNSGLSSLRQTFDLTSLTSGGDAGMSPSITDVGDGWRELTVTFPSAATGTGGILIAGATSTAAARLASYAGDAATGFVVAQPQVVLGATINGYAPTTTVAAYRTLYVDTWYDQSGNGRDATYSQASSVGSNPSTGRLRIVNQGTVETIGGVPTLVAPASRVGVATPTFAHPSGALTLSVVTPATVPTMRLAQFTTPALLDSGFERDSGGTSRPILGRTVRTDSVAAGIPASGGLVLTQEMTGTTHRIWRNGALGATAAVAGAAQTGDSVLLMGQGNGGSTGGDRLSEVVLTGPVTDRERSALEASQGSYYGIALASTASSSEPAPVSRPLDSLGAAHAAYSLRRLRSAYSGPAIRVSRPGDGVQTDIGFAVDGGLDTSAITAFAAADTKENLLLQSEDLSTASWSKTRGSVAAAGTHNGSPAWQFTEDTALGTHGVNSGGISRPAGTALTVRLRVKDAGRRYVQIVPGTAISLTSQNFDLTDLTAQSGTGLNPTITDVGGGWRELTVTYPAAAAAASGGIYVMGITAMNAPRFQDYPGDGTSAFVIAQPQATLGSTPQPYTATTTTAYDRSVYVETWYDQSGNGRDATYTQAAAVGTNPATAKLRIASSGIVETTNGLPTLVAPAARTGVATATFPHPVGALTLSMVTPAALTAMRQAYFTTPALLDQAYQMSSSDGKSYPILGRTARTNSVDAGLPANGGLILTEESTGTNFKLWRNGVLGATAAASGAAQTTDSLLFMGQGISGGGGARLSEVVLTGGLTDDERQLLERSQRAFYGIAMPARSVPRYAYVETWHDQSGNGRDLTQTTKSRQPRIVADGVIETLGGRPAVRVRASDTLERTGSLGAAASELDVLATVSLTSPLVAGDLLRFSPDAGPRIAGSVAADGQWSWDAGGAAGANRVSAPGPGAGTPVVAAMTNSVAQQRQQLRLGGWTAASDETGHAVTADRIRVGDGADASVSELLLLPTLTSARRAALEQSAMQQFAAAQSDILTLRSAPAQDSVTPVDSATFRFATAASGTALGGVRCRLDDGAWQPCRSPHQVTGLSAGRHTLQIEPLNGIDLQSGPALTRSWTVQGSTVTGGPASVVDDEDGATFTFSTPAGTGAQCQLDDGAWQACSSPHRVPHVSDGDHRFAVRAISGAETGPAATWRWRAAAQLSVRLLGTPPALLRSSSATFTFAAARPQDAAQCRMDAGAWSPCASPHTVTGLADGRHTFEVRAASPAGRVEGLAPSFAFTVDTTAPSTKLGGVPTRATFDPTVTVRLSSNEPDVSYECRVDDSAWETCSPVHERQLDAGRHVLQARATDAAGNVDPDPATATVQIREVDAPKLSASSGGSAKGDTRLRCDIDRPAGAASISYRWLRDGAPLKRSRSSRLTTADAVDGSALRCEATITFASGATTTVRSPVTLVLGADRLQALRFAEKVKAGRRLPSVRFTATRGARIDVRLRARSSQRVLAARVARSRGDVTRVALGRALPKGEYTLTVRLIRRKASTRLRTSAPLSTTFTVR